MSGFYKYANEDPDFVAVVVPHGTEDDVVPPFAARVLVDAHGSGELRFVTGAGHRLRHDPRAIAILLGWLDRVKAT